MSDIKKVMATAEGRRFINELLGFCGVYQSSAGEINDILRQEGKRQVGLFLLGMIQESDRNMLYKMMDEAFIANKEKEYGREHDERKQRDDHYSGNNPDPREYFSVEPGYNDSGYDLNL